MNHPQQAPLTTNNSAPNIPAVIPVVEAAKWPPDDADLPSGGAPGGALPPGGGAPVYGGAQGGGYGGGDGDFKKGRFGMVAVLVGMLLVVGIGLAVFFGLKQDAESLTQKQIADEKKNLALLPKEQQLPKWREWAARNDVPKMQEEAFAQLAWERDQAGLPLIIKGLANVDHRIRGTAASALLEYGSPAADSAKPVLLKALAESDSGDKPQIAWTLAALHEPAAFDEVMKEYRLGHLAKVQKLDGNPTFDPEVMAAMVPLDKIASLAGDESESVRQLVSTMLSKNADPKFTGVLIKLVDDKSADVGREAAVGLGKIANEQAMGPLLSALSRADKDSRQKFLEALRDGVGAKGLVLAIRSVQKDPPQREKFQTKQLFDMMHDLEDPRAGDALIAYINSNPPPKPHWKTEAAMRLAEVGDLRAVPVLAWRMKQDPLKIYNKADDPELMQDDNERVVSARMLADLAMLFPDKRPEILSQAEDGVLSWATDKPQPHANAMRFLATADARDALPRMRKWANPGDRFPQPGQQDFPQSWATAQSGLRYLGWMKDPESWSVLESQLSRRPAKVDATMESLKQGGLAVLGMTLRAIGVGAAHGFAQWGDSKAYAPLVKYIENSEENEQSRLEACFSLSWVATDEQMIEVVSKVKKFSKADPKESLIRACYLETLIHRPVPSATAGLVELIKPDTDLEVRHQAARAIGFGGVQGPTASKLLELIKDPQVRSDAALAILIGADTDTVSRMMAMFNDYDPGAMEELKVIYNQTFGYWSDKNFENGDLARWISNAQACGHVRVKDALQDWPRLILSRAIQGIDYDNGPHSVTRVQLRIRLMRDALGQDAKKRDQAIVILKFMREKGVLMALRGETGPVGEQARQAFFEIMNPKATTDLLPQVKVPAGAAVVPPK